MDLINWSLNAIDTIFSTRSTGSGEPNCPDGTYPAGYTMDAWDRWRVVCLAALSVEDIEDIYLFGTMITGLLLIGLGFALGYRRIKETGTAVQSLTRLPVMIEAVGRAVSIETETINRNMDSITEKLTALQRKIDGDQNGQWEQPWNWNAVTRPKTKQAQSYLFRLPLPALALVGSCWEINPEKHRRETLSAFLPHSSDTCWLHIHTLITNYYTYRHFPKTPDPHASVALNRQPDKRVWDQR